MKLQKFKNLKSNLKKIKYEYGLNFGTKHPVARGILNGVLINFKAEILKFLINFIRNIIFYYFINNNIIFFSFLHKYSLAIKICHFSNYLELIYFKDWKYCWILSTNKNVFKSAIVKMLKDQKC